MARVHVTGGYLNVQGFGGEYPGNELPGAEGPVDPGYGISADRPSNPIVLPPDPPGVWPGPRPSHPIVIAPPGTPPGVIWPTPGARPDNTLPGDQPRPNQGLPPGPVHPEHPIASQNVLDACIYAIIRMEICDREPFATSKPRFTITAAHANAAQVEQQAHRGFTS